jgi:hypothetical protein
MRMLGDRPVGLDSRVPDPLGFQVIGIELHEYIAMAVINSIPVQNAWVHVFYSGR